MLIEISSFCELNARALMDIYAESNAENAAELYPEMEKEAAVARIEKEFLEFLENTFFKSEESKYCVLSENGAWVSALRLCRVRGHEQKPDSALYYLEALETSPELRRRGHAAKLLSLVIEKLKEGGAFSIRDCVSKRNAASLKTHKKCGFRIVAEQGFDLLSDDPNRPKENSFSLEYSFKG